MLGWNLAISQAKKSVLIFFSFWQYLGSKFKIDFKARMLKKKKKEKKRGVLILKSTNLSLYVVHSVKFSRLYMLCVYTCILSLKIQCISPQMEFLREVIPDKIIRNVELYWGVKGLGCVRREEPDVIQNFKKYVIILIVIASYLVFLRCHF